MVSISNIPAVIFDMDGTLVDSEVLTGPAIMAFCHENSIDEANVDCSEFFGASWASIERCIVDCYPQLAGNPNIRMGIEEHVTYYAGADDYREPKPAPDGFLKAAEVLQTRPQNCLVFEDSIAGIQAAKTAGMWVVAITHRSNDVRLATKLADLAVTDFSELDNDFFDVIRIET